MKVYHSSTVVVNTPVTSHSRLYLDFGPGFYLTTLHEQAVKYAERFIRRGKNAILNIYELNDNLSSNWEVKRFEKYDETWLDYVTECRSGSIPDSSDIIIGGIANDKVFRTLDLYFAGYITKEEALHRLKYEKTNNQICIRTQAVLDNELTFLESQQL